MSSSDKMRQGALRFPHRLPMELLPEVFLYAAAEDRETCRNLCLVCKSARNWTLPALYTTVVLTSSSQILGFAWSVMSSAVQYGSITGEQDLGSYVRHIWFGPTSATAEHDLSYASTAWPVTLIHQILSHCTGLRALAVINFAQHLIYRLEGVIPATVESIHLGPVHGHLDVPKLRCAHLRSITSMDTYLSDWEVQELVMSPHIRCFRRFYSNPARISFAFDQLPCLAKATTIESMQILCCDDTAENAERAMADLAKQYKDNADERVELIALSVRQNGSGRSDGILVLYEDWLVGLGLSLRTVQICRRMLTYT